MNSYVLISKIKQDLSEIRKSLARIEKALKIVPDKELAIKDFESSLKDYEEYAKEILKLEEITINNHKSAIRRFLFHCKGRISQGVLARHYTDYSPKALREQYNKVEPFLTFKEDS